MTYRMNAFWEWFYGTPAAGYFSMEKSANMYIVHTKFIPQNCQCAQVYPVHRCRKIFRIQYRTWNLVNKINVLHGHWSTHTLEFWIDFLEINITWHVKEQSTLKVSFPPHKGQIKPKADSPKKWMNQFVLFAFLLFTANKTNSFVLFLGEYTAHPNCFWFYLTFITE